MSNLSIQPLLNAASNPAQRNGRSDSEAVDRNDPALAFNAVMQRHGSRDAPARGGDAPRPREAESARPAQRTPPGDGARPAGTTIKGEAAPSSRPIARSERAEPVDNASGNPAQAITHTRAAASAPMNDTAVGTDAPDTATGDLFADLGLALAAAGKVATAPAPAVEPAPMAGDPDTQTDPAALARPVASTLALSPGLDIGTLPAQRSAPIDDRGERASTHPGARAPRVIDGARSSTAPSKFAGNAAPPLTPVDARPDERIAVESEFAGLPAHDARAIPAARSEPVAGTPLSLSAALSPGTGAAPGSTATTFSIAHAQVGAAVGQHGFSDEFSQRVTLLVGQRVQFAEIALNPAELGPISVTVDVRGQEASLVFGASQSATRHAIEEALPRLREMFQSHGLHLVDAHVGAQLGHHGRRDNTSAGSARNTREAHTVPVGEVATSSTATVSLPAHSLRLIDVRV